LIEEEAVLNSKWLSEKEFSDLVAIAASTPGPIALNAATYIGYKLGGVLGATIASFAVVLPPFITILLIAYGLSFYINNIYVKGFINGLKAVVLGLFMMSALTTFRSVFTSLNTPFQIIFILVLTMLFIVMLSWIKLEPLMAVLITGLLGVLATVLGIW